MAKVEGFKNKITKAQEDLFKALETEKEKKNALFIKITAELAKQNKANSKLLNTYNKEYVELCKQNNVILDEFILKVNELNNTLADTVEKYNAFPNEEQELNEIQENNENKKRIITNKFKREMQDVNIKIDRIEKELKEVLEENKNTYDDDINNYKAKLLELDKRRKFDIGKIQNNTIKEYDELQVKLLKENKRSEIKLINKGIKQIRLNGLLEEKECLFRHLAEHKQAELEYFKMQYDYKVKCITLEKEYCNRVEEAKYDRSMIQFNYKKNIDSADNNASHVFNQNIQKKKVQKNKDFEDLYNALKQAYEEQYKNESEKATLENDKIKNIYRQIEELDEKQSVKLFEFNDKGLASLNKEISLFGKNIILTLSFYAQNINTIYKTYFTNLLSKEEDFVKSLIVNAINGEFLLGNNYDENVVKINEIYEAFKSKEEEIINNFNEYINNALNNLLIQVENFIDSINNINNQITNIFSEHHQNINVVLEEAKNKGIDYSNNIKSEIDIQIQDKLNKNEELYASRCAEVSAINSQIEKEYSDREMVVKATEDKQQEEYLKDYEVILKDRDSAKVVVEEKAVKDTGVALAEYEEKVKQLNDKYETLHENVEKEYKTKIGLL